VKKALIVVGSLTVTGFLLVVVFSLGSWGFKQRQASLHAGRLQRLTGLHPTAEQVQAGLEEEGARLVGRATTANELRVLGGRWGKASQDAISAAGQRFPNARVFLAGDTVYFLFFDHDGVLQEFLVVMP
jgi:hypothetical protein